MDNEFKLPHHHQDIEEEKRIMRLMPDDTKVTTVAEAMKQLGDPSRLRIFWLLCHTEECVLDIASLVRMTSPAVSHHLKQLKEAGLIVSRRCGKEMLYRAADTVLAQKLHEVIEDVADITCPG